MSVLVRRPQIVATLNGTPLANVTSASVVTGYDRRTSEARVTIAGQRGAAALPVGAEPWQPLVVQMSAAGTPTQRFSGFYVEPDWTLWPKSVTLVARGPLVLAQLTTCSNPDGINYANFTDIQLVEAVLAACGIGDVDIQGIGVTLGSFNPGAFLWRQGQSALDFLSQFDEVCLGWRVFETASGSVVRRQVSISPAPAPSWTFSEGVDITSATAQARVVDGANRVAVTGAQIGDGDPVRAVRVQASPFLPDGLTVTAAYSSPMIERSQGTDPGPGIAAGDVAEWRIKEINRQLVAIPMQTYRDNAVAPGDTVRVDGPTRLGTDATYWVQSISVQQAADGGFSQTLTCLGGPGSDAPILAPPLADFELDTELETVLVGGAEAALTVARARDTSIIQAGSLAARVWTASAGGNPSTGSDADFLSGFADVGAATITLTVTDSNGLSSSRTRAVQPAAQSPQERVIIVAESSDLCLFNGNAWVTQSVPSGPVLSCGNAPLWGSGDRVYRSLDRLATPAPYSVPLAGVDVIGLSATRGFSPIAGTDLSATTVVAGLANGQLAISRDGAQNWTLAWTPADSDFVWAGASPYDAHFIQVVLRLGSWVTFDDGQTWSNIFYLDYPEVVEDASFSAHAFGSGTPSSHFFATSAGRLVRAEDGAECVFPTMDPPITSITNVTSAIAIDRLYAVDQLSRTYRSDPVGSLTMVHTGVLPQPGIQPHGLQADGEYEGLVYAALGSSGLYKSIDGLQTAYYPLRVPGVAGAPDDALLRMVGFGELLTPSLTPAPGSGDVGAGPVTVTSHVGSANNQPVIRALSLWNGAGNNAAPAGWQGRGFDEASWGPAAPGFALFDASGLAVAALWSGALPHSETEIVLFRQSFALPVGTIAGATLAVSADDNCQIWLNGIFVYASPSGSHTGGYPYETVTLDPALLLPGQTNVLAIEGSNNEAPGSPVGTHAWVKWKLDIT